MTDPIDQWSRADSAAAKAVAGNRLVDEIRRLRQELRATQKQLDNALDNLDAQIRKNTRMEDTKPVRSEFPERTLGEVLASLPEEEQKAIQDRSEEIMARTGKDRAHPKRCRECDQVDGHLWFCATGHSSADL